MKLNILIFFVLFAVFPFYSESFLFNEVNYEEYVLENGVQLFVMEDFSAAPVRIEYSVRAGISSQNKTDTGFFPLYTRLFKYASSEQQLSKMTADCNADSSRYIITVSPSKVKETMETISKHAFDPVFSDAAIEKELAEFKKEIMQYAYTPAAFINSSIDARVFSSAPWKQDSGIYPSLFAKITPSQARTILSSISRNWYTPQNSAIFISGSIKKEAALKIAEETFGKYPRAIKSESTISVPAGGKIRKFVMHDSQFSEDITQIIIQYTSLSMNQCEIAATTLNSDFSSLKKNLINEPKLNIRGPEYINIAAAHKNGTSRLIYQALLEKNKFSPLDQSNSFISTVTKSHELTYDEEFIAAKRYLSKNFYSITSDSTMFMNYLSQYWAIDHLIEGNNQTLLQKIMAKHLEIDSENSETIKTILNNETPFIFVLVNTKTYNKYFKNSDFEVITQKNGSWYTQKLKDNVLSTLPELNKFQQNTDYNSQESLEKFITDSKKNINPYQLKNGIKVTLKKNSNSSFASILIKINGGKFSDAGKPGFETLMANAVCSNIQKEFNKYAQSGILDGYPTVQSETDNTESFIIIDCQTNDISVCLKAIGDAIIFSDIKPAEADSYVYAVQTQKRLHDGNPVNQMTFQGIKYLFENPVYRDIFDSEKDILVNTTYTDILAAYPKLLDANRYEIVIAGNFDSESVLSTLEKSMGMLSPHNNTFSSIPLSTPVFPAKSKRLNVKLRHLFYTDISADKAGPMPAVLVPTKNFADPVQFWLCAPAFDSKESIIFNGLLFRLKELLESQNNEIKLMLPTKELPVAAITFFNVSRTSEIDRIYSSTVLTLSKVLNAQNIESYKEGEEIKNSWILNTLTETQSNKGTAKLIAKGSHPEEFLEDYRFILNCTDADFATTAEKYLKADAPLKIYSADSKR